MSDFYIACGLPSYLFMSWVPSLWSFQQMSYGNGVFVGCILYFGNTTIFYLFAMFLCLITFTQHHNLFLGFAICKCIVYTITKRMIYTYSYYLCHATSLPNVRQHHLSNMDLPLEHPMLGSTSSIIGSLHPFNTCGTNLPSVGWKWIWAIGHDVLRPCLTTDYAFQVFNLPLMILLNFVALFIKNLPLFFFLIFFWSSIQKTNTAHKREMQMNLLNKKSIDQIWIVWIICTCIWYFENC